jgi:hypothetical protein
VTFHVRRQGIALSLWHRNSDCAEEKEFICRQLKVVINVFLIFDVIIIIIIIIIITIIIIMKIILIVVVFVT